MSWLDKVKDHVGSGITSSSTGTYTTPLLSQSAKDALEKAETLRRVQAAQDAMLNSAIIYQQGGGGGSGGSYITSGGYINPIGSRWSPRDKILMRLNTPDGELVGFDYIEATKLSDDKMVVFVINNGKHCTIEDDAHLFPSDTLITQLRILRK